jgi:hypothetical protein
MDTVPVWVNLLNPVRRQANSAECNQHRTRLCANGRFWRILLKKSPLARERNFSAPLVRPKLGDVRDHIDSRKSDQ